jgi:glycosyltransferase involved in cell wall biosynthesis
MAADRLDLRLLVVGEFYEDEQKYLSLIRELDLARHVRMHSGYLPNDRVALFFSAADAVVLPYVSATQSGIAQIAYHYDVPVIATAVGGLAEVVLDGRTGFIVPPGDPVALSDAIVRFFEEQHSGRFAANIREEKKKYSWDALAEAIEELAVVETASPSTRESIT